MTLKTFHFAGVASMNVTMGVPRIAEIVGAATNISTPIISADLVDQDQEIPARIVKGRIETTRLGDICKYIKEVYTPKGCYLAIKLSKDNIERLKLEVDMDTIIQSIVKTRGIKLKYNPHQKGDKQKKSESHITKVSPIELHIAPFDTSKEGMYFCM
jgi:DNA-directed RNA polymerase III subunit RPC1